MAFSSGELRFLCFFEDFILKRLFGIGFLLIIIWFLEPVICLMVQSGTYYILLYCLLYYTSLWKNYLLYLCILPMYCFQYLCKMTWILFPFTSFPLLFYSPIPRLTGRRFLLWGVARYGVPPGLWKSSFFRGELLVFGLTGHFRWLSLNDQVGKGQGVLLENVLCSNKLTFNKKCFVM